jgi:hypothetical protein
MDHEFLVALGARGADHLLERLRVIFVLGDDMAGDQIRRGAPAFELLVKPIAADLPRRPKTLPLRNQVLRNPAKRPSAFGALAAQPVEHMLVAPLVAGFGPAPPHSPVDEMVHVNARIARPQAAIVVVEHVAAQAAKVDLAAHAEV